MEKSLLPATKKISEKIELNKLSITELRRIYDEISEIYHQIRIRVLTYLGAEFALLSYLYISGNDNENTLQKLFIPQEAYGIILYWISFASCIAALVLLISAMQTVQWRYPTEINNHKKLEYKNTLQFLEYIRKEYVDALEINIEHCEKKQKRTTTASYLLIFGGILLIIIKNF